MTRKDIDWKDVMPENSSNPDSETWQQTMESAFGGGTSEPIKPAHYELNERELAFLRGNASTWVDPMRFTVYKNAVIMYVKTHRSAFDYPTCLGLYDHPEAVLEAVLNSKEYRDYLGWNAKVPSNADLVSMMIKDGEYEFAGNDYVTSQCERAIAYWHKTHEGNL